MATTTFVRTHTASRGASTYKAEGYPGVVMLAKPAFNGEHPETLEIEGVPQPAAAVRASRATMTPEERKARAAERRAELASLTPAERAARKAEAARVALAKAEALLQKANAAA